MGARPRRVVCVLAGPAAVPTRSRVGRRRAAHARAGEAPRRQVCRRRRLAGWPDDRLRARAPSARRGRRGRRGQRARGARRAPAVSAATDRHRAGLRLEPAIQPGRNQAVLVRVGSPEHAVGRHPADRPGAPDRRGRLGRGRPAGVCVRAALARGRLARVHQRPQRLVERVHVDAGRGRGRAADRARGGNRGSGVGIRERALLLSRRRAGRVRLHARRNRPGGDAAPRRRDRRPGASILAGSRRADDRRIERRRDRLDPDGRVRGGAARANRAVRRGAPSGAPAR